MRRSLFILPVLAFVVATGMGTLNAQGPNDLYCAVTFEGQNQKRTVAGDVNVECGWATEPFHSAPWGNWGVNSFYGGKTDTDQFRGWKHVDGPPTKRQWNSCTTRVPKYRARNCDYYNANNCTTQRSSDVVTHGIVTYRTRNQCPQYLDPNNPQPSGCANMTTATVHNNNMELFELDADRSDPVENLYFPRTSVTFRNCDYDGCPERSSGWIRMTGSSSAEADVRAELRMKAKAQVVGVCDTGTNSDWNWD